MCENEELAKCLKLIDHPEGGKFLETFKATRQVQVVGDGSELYDGPRLAGTSVYYLMEKEHFISWHKHKSHCLFFWHKGGVVKVHQISPDGTYSCDLFGDPLLHQGAQLQMNVQPGTYYAKELVDKTTYALYGCVLTPGFEFKDWSPGKAADLTSLCPKEKETIERLTSSQ